MTKEKRTMELTTDDQYAKFGQACAGIMDSYYDYGVTEHAVVETIKLAAATYGIALGTR
jgi:hypothetical protein